ncbi:periplasmic flagellar collar protein FlcA [Sediminispirochaeta bajacaliforniensis]|uniref:periplasmic flagellar collar protein FlcA n=1 Tax=Sediminispirochaeta bajacaliforniensis TaxID=148 RepID=UPI000374F8AB|nr:tetratricopeptide repeat protein [Sediminispirochaeta bajacaliforniensis]
MPEIQDIEQFKSNFLVVGNEPSILAGKGEKVRDVTPPESGLSEDLSLLLDEVDQELGIESGQEDDRARTSEGPAEIPLDIEEAAEASEETPDLDDFLASFDEQAAGMDEDFFDEEVPEAGGPAAEVEGPEEEPTPWEPEAEETESAEEQEPEELESPFELEELELPEMDEDLFAEETSEIGEPAGEEEAAEEEPTPWEPEAEETESAEEQEPEELESSFELEEPEELELPEMDEDLFTEEASALGEPAATEEESSPDAFSLPDIDEGGEEFELPDFGNVSDGEEAEELQEIGDEDFELDEFSLGDLGQDFDVLEETPETPGFDLEGPSAEAGELFETAVQEISLEDKDFDHVKEHLGSLPLNLKLLIEEQIGEAELSGNELKQLLESLKSGRSPKDIANLVGKITGKRVKIPREYEKRTGTAFEEERDSFSYRFRRNVLPVIRTALLTAAAFALVIFLSYRFIYRPVKAYTLYQKGYKHLSTEEYPQSGSYFDQATDIWPMKGQFYRYGEGYRSAGQWPRAEAIYERLLSRYRLDKQGTLAYARMEYEDLANYPKATSILKTFLSDEEHIDDYDALLLSSDINLEWGKDDPSKLEDARFALATLMNNYGIQDEFLFRMLRYFIRTDNLQEVETLRRRFQAEPKLEVDAAAYAELGGYLLDKGHIDEVREVLFRAKEQEPRLPEVHYNLARFFDTVDDTVEEEKALINSIELMSALPILNGDRHFMFMDSYRRIGEIHFARSEFLEAESAYDKGIALYESARARGIMPVKQEAGILYSDRADIPYYVGGDLDLALDYLKKAKANRYAEPKVDYKIGYIYYRKEEYRKALLNFSSATEGFSSNDVLNFAIANTLYRRNNLQAAEGYYRSIVDHLNDRRQSLENFMPEERSSHRAVVENLIRADNNLAVTLYQMYKRTARGSFYTDSLRYLSSANELFENEHRDPESLVRTELKNLAFLNQQGMVYPNSDYDPQIYPEIPKDPESLFFAD